MIGIILPVLLSVGLVVSPPQADSLGSPGGALPELPASSEAAATPPSDAALTGGLPARPVPPATMRDQWPVFVLFALTWIGIVGYLVATGRRAARLADEVSTREERR